MPGEERGTVETERSYAALRQRVGADTSLTPTPKRIFNLACRFEGRDCTLEVGQPAPSGEGAVLAILHVGGDQPYVVEMTDDQPPLRLGKRVYSITEFRA